MELNLCYASSCHVTAPGKYFQYHFLCLDSYMLRLVGRSVRRARGGVILKSTTDKGGLL
jgi:hypothetical protein